MGIEMLQDSESPFMTYQDPKSFSAGDSAWSFDSTCSESTAGGSTASSVKVYIWALEKSWTITAKFMSYFLKWKRVGDCSFFFYRIPLLFWTLVTIVGEEEMYIGII